MAKLTIILAVLSLLATCLQAKLISIDKEGKISGSGDDREKKEDEISGSGYKAGNEEQPDNGDDEDYNTGSGLRNTGESGSGLRNTGESGSGLGAGSANGIFDRKEQQLWRLLRKQLRKHGLSLYKTKSQQ